MALNFRESIMTRAVLGAAVLVVSFSPQAWLADYRADLALPFPVGADADRVAYRAWGLESASTWQVWHPRTILRYAALTARGMKAERSKGEDLNQLGGDFVVDARGRIAWEHKSARPDDRPSIRHVLRALRRA